MCDNGDQDSWPPLTVKAEIFYWECLLKLYS